ncbi:MAG: DNA methyltransferase, partial [Candidatus Thorarchaeota archaeon]
KMFRQTAASIHELFFKIEKKGNFNNKNILNNLTGKEWLRHTKSWIVMDGKPSDIPREIKDHPASFPPDLIEYFIEFFTKKGGWVFDPFIGIGSTAVACLNLARNCWGTETNSKYFNYAIKRIKEKVNTLKLSDNLTCKIFNEDCRGLLKLHEENNYPSIDFCITSPPYWNILETSRGGVKSTHKKRIENGLDEKYSNDPNDLGNISTYEEYLKELEIIFNIIFKLLKSDGYLMIIVQNVRPKGGIIIPIAWDLAKVLSKSYKMRQEFIWCQNQKQLGIWGYPKTYVSNVHHHYCLVFQK